ncbi:MAG: bifunctional phosphoribosylaminoimidazolecarboxamide formyltransferase/IMP cyclohydrolase, partial [Steroidobacteraceae bacterium]|nr:bifunctional phosphoribosylaminoimidazolecarboxamide formyltransferase/IMP cyclohydrolase [Steroidobacteraceae bacterium]
LLGRRGSDDAVMREHGIQPIDLLIVNLYPFAATVNRPDCRFDDGIENIDIGGPAMLRAGAKNHAAVTVAVDPADYPVIVDELQRYGGCTTLETRRRLATKAFAHTAQYDATIAAWLAAQVERGSDAFPDVLTLSFIRREVLRYGENPHQRAAFYRDPLPRGAQVATAQLLQGKDLSYNNIADADTAIECVRQFTECACVIVKHANPCGVALGATPLEAYERAWRTDPTSAFGGIVACNRELDAGTARQIVERQFVEVLAAPSIADTAREVLAAKPNVRVLVTGELSLPRAAGLEFRSVAGGLLAQTRDEESLDLQRLRVVTRRQPSEREVADLQFAWRVAKFVKSNAIVYARDGATVGIGAG